MAEYTLYGFAQSGNAYKPALMLELAGADWAPRFVDYFDDEIGVDWKATHPNIAAWLARIASEPRWRHPYRLLPGHPRPGS